MVILQADLMSCIKVSEEKPGINIGIQGLHTKIPNLARLKYVMNNPVKHKIVGDALEYPWCSARWFKEKAGKAYFQTVDRFTAANINVVDEF